MRRSRSLSRTAINAGVLVGLLGATLSLHAAPEIYPPLREGIEPAVATLNVDAPMLQRGAGSYRRNCSACHGADGAGGGAVVRTHG